MIYCLVLYKKTNLGIGRSKTVSGMSHLPFLSSMVLLNYSLTFLTRLPALVMTCYQMTFFDLWVTKQKAV